MKIGSIVIHCYGFDRMLAFWQEAPFSVVGFRQTGRRRWANRGCSVPPSCPLPQALPEPALERTIIPDRFRDEIGKGPPHRTIRLGRRLEILLQR